MLPWARTRRSGTRVRRGHRHGVIALAVVVALVVIVRTQVLDLLTVVSDSMSPTVCVGDTAVLERLHGKPDIRTGDVVTFRDPLADGEMLKRVVAVAGQKVSIEDAVLTIDGVAINETWVDYRSIDGLYFGPVTVPEGRVFVMGDHREISIDSRQFGTIGVADLDGRLLGTIFSHCP